MSLNRQKVDQGIYVTGELYTYLLKNGVREHEALAGLREKTASHPRAVMQISPDEGQFLQFLVRILGAKKTIEVGVFTGYSSLATALALPADGKVIACDISEEYASIGRPFWKDAGVEHKIDLRIANAVDTLDKLISEKQENTFDFAFIDADKTNYMNYYERLLKLVRVGGVIAIDNVLWHGAVVQPENVDEDTVAIRKLNEFIHNDDRVYISMLGIADGVTLITRKN